MSKNSKDSGQTLLKVITRIDENKNKEHIASSSGQALLFGVQKEFVPMVPEELKPFADFIGNKLVQTQRENKSLKSEIKRNTEQLGRVGNTLARVASKLEEKTVSEVNPDLVISPHASIEQADVAFVDSNLPAEAIYTKTPGDLAKIVGNDKMTPSMMGGVLRKLNIFGNDRFHHESIRGKSRLHSYKPQTVDEIYSRIANPEAYGLDVAEVTKVTNYIKPREAMNQ